MHHVRTVPAAPHDTAARRDPALPEPRVMTHEIVFGPRDLREVRAYVAQHAAESGLEGDDAFDLLVAVSEIATNSVTHGGGSGSLRMWCDDECVVCEFSDSGRVIDPEAGLVRPDPELESNRGLWLAHQLCDSVQLRVSEHGTVVRLHKRLAATAG